MADPETLSTVASIISGFGIAMLFFRIQRELLMGKKGEPIWIPYSDWLLIIATVISLLLVILPLILLSFLPSFLSALPSAACVTATIMVTGYIFGILAHYRLILAGSRSGPRDNPEPSEKIIVRMTVALAAISFLVILSVSCLKYASLLLMVTTPGREILGTL